jgi:hypothetical protein
MSTAFKVMALSYPACASRTFAPPKVFEVRQGTLYWRAIWPIMKFIKLISGVPAIGTPDRILTVAK